MTIESGLISDTMTQPVLLGHPHLPAHLALATVVGYERLTEEEQEQFGGCDISW